VGKPDPHLTPVAGLEAVRETDRVLGVTRALDAHVGSLKTRNRGLSGGEAVMAMVRAQLAGEDFMVGLDRRRTDVAGELLEDVATPASTTWRSIAARFTPEAFTGIEEAIAQVNGEVLARVPASRGLSLLKCVTLDGDATDIEVYGHSKEKAAHSYTGARILRGHFVSWAELGAPVAAELMGGVEDPRSNCVDLLERAVGNLPEGVGEIRTRYDAGYFADKLARACIRLNVRFAIGAKRTAPLMAQASRTAEREWLPAIGMADTEVAVVDYLPASWPEDANITCIARRTRIPVDQIPTGRARKRRTIPKDQLTLALGGGIDYVYGYSFILTDLTTSDPEDCEDTDRGQTIAEVEYWYRHRTDIEALNKDAKYGAALRHMPSATHTVNTVWMWCALLACALSSWTQEITHLDHHNGRGRRTLARFCRDLIRIPARITQGGRTLTLRPPPHHHGLLAYVLASLKAMPART